MSSIPNVWNATSFVWLVWLFLSLAAATANPALATCTLKS